MLSWNEDGKQEGSEGEFFFPSEEEVGEKRID